MDKQTGTPDSIGNQAHGIIKDAKPYLESMEHRNRLEEVIEAISSSRREIRFQTNSLAAKGLTRFFETLLGKREEVYERGLPGLTGVKRLRECLGKQRKQRDELMQGDQILPNDKDALERAEKELTDIVDQMMEKDPNLGLILQKRIDQEIFHYFEVIFPEPDTWENDVGRMPFQELERVIAKHRVGANLGSRSGYEEAGHRQMQAPGEIIKNAGYKYDLIEISKDPNAEEEKKLKKGEKISAQRIAHYLIHNE